MQSMPVTAKLSTYLVLLCLTFLLANQSWAQTYSYGSGSHTNTDGDYNVSWSTTNAQVKGLYEQVGNGSPNRISTSRSGNIRLVRDNATYKYLYRLRVCRRIGPGEPECNFQYSSVGLTIKVDTPPLQPPSTSPSFSGLQNVNTYSTTADLRVSWPTVDRAAAFRLEEYVSGSWRHVYGGQNRSVDFADRGMGDYRFRVRACNAAGCSGWSSTKTYRISQINNFSMPTTSRGTFTLQFSDPIREYVNIRENGVTLQTGYTGNTLQLDKLNGTYRFSVQSCVRTSDYGPPTCGGYGREQSVTVLHIPSTPPSFTMPSYSPNVAFTAEWARASGVVHNYDVDYARDGGAWQNLSDPSGLSAAITLSEGAYQFRVRACNTLAGSKGCSAFQVSQVMSARRPAVVPTISLAGTDTDGAYYVGWSTIVNTKNYTLQELNTSGSWQTVEGSLNTRKSFSGKANRVYTYRVRACNDFGCTNFSPQKSTIVAKTPSTPSSISPPSNNSLTVSWANISNEFTRFELSRRFNGGSHKEIYRGTDTSRQLTNLADGNYQFSIRACIVVSTFTNCSAYLSTSAVSLAKPAAAPVINLAATDDNGAYPVSWDAISLANRYNLYERVNGGNPASVQNNATTQYPASSRGNNTYAYQVEACNAMGCSALSSAKNIDVAITPGTPGAFILPSQHGKKSLEVKWNAASGRVSFYSLAWRPGSGNYRDLNSPSLNVYLHANLEIGDYQYRVAACNRVGAYTNCGPERVSSVVQLARPAPPGGVRQSQNEASGSYEISWGEVTNTLNYLVEEQKGFGAWTEVQNTTSRRYSSTGAPQYSNKYRVSACNELGCSTARESERVVRLADIADWAQFVPVDIPDAEAASFSPAEHDATVGAIAGSGGVSGGQANYAIPITLPPGRAGMTPNVALSYSSNDGNGIAGMGFSLSASGAISRCGQSVVYDGINKGVTYTSDDRLCFNGMRILKESDTAVYGAPGTQYRLEQSPNVSIKQHYSLNSSSSFFEITYPDGSHEVYGGDSGNHVVEAGGVEFVKDWLLAERKDLAGNSIHFDYEKYASGEHLISNIYYTGFGDERGNRRVEFTYQNRPDISSAYLLGGLSAQTKRLHKIETYVGGTQVREYTLAYKLSEASRRSLLENIEECGFDESIAVCLPKTELQWLDAKHQYVLEPLGYKTSENTSITQIEPKSRIKQVLPRGDQNGDGTPDWPEFEMDAEGIGRATKLSSSKCYRSVLTQKYQCIEADFNQDGMSDDWEVTDEYLRLNISSPAAANDQVIVTGLRIRGEFSVDNIGDYNGDSWPDIVYLEDPDGKYGNADPTLRLALHSGNISSPYSQSQLIYSAQRAPGERFSRALKKSASPVGDMNGDGHPDFLVYDHELDVLSAAWSASAQPSPVAILYTKVSSQGAISFETQSLEGLAEFGVEANHYNFHMFMDINGDGLEDWLTWKDQVGHLWLRLNKGGSFADWQDLGASSRLAARMVPIPAVKQDEPEVTIINYPKYGHALTQYDVDADGRAELLTPSSIAASACKVYRSQNEQTRRCGNDIYQMFPVVQNNRTVSVVVDSLGESDRNVFNYRALKFVEVSPGQFTVEAVATGIVADATQKAGIDAFGNGLSDMVFAFGWGDWVRTDPTNPTIGRNEGALKDFPEGLYINRNRGSAKDGERYQPTDMLTSVVNGMGVADEWDYRPVSTKDKNFHSTSFPFYEPDFDYLNTLSDRDRLDHMHFTSSMYVVAEHRQSNGVKEGFPGIDGMNARQYRYKGAMMNRRGRGFQGFRTIIEEDITSGIASRSDFHQVFPLAGKLVKSRKWLADFGKTYEHAADASSDSALESTAAFDEKNFTWWFRAMSPGSSSSERTITSLSDSWTTRLGDRYYVKMKSQNAIRRKLALNANSRDELFQSTVTYSYNSWGSLTEERATYQEPGGVNRVTSKTTTEYDENVISNGWFDKIITQTIEKNPVENRHAEAPSIEPETDQSHLLTTTYDEWDEAYRKPKKLMTSPSSGKDTGLETLYNLYGLPTAIVSSGQGESDRTNTITYSEDGYFVRTQVNALQHAIEQETDARFGVVIWADDANKIRSSNYYDPFGRVIESVVEGASVPQYSSLQWCTGYCRSSDAVYKIITEAEGQPRSVSYIDKLGRTVLSETASFGQVIFQQQKFNDRGLLTFERVPTKEWLAVHAKYYVRYDALGRLLEKQTDKTRGQVLTTLYQHEQGTRGFTTEITAGNLSLSRSYNGLQQLVSTRDAMLGVTRYAYDGAGNPIVMQDPNGNKIVAQYNALGQKNYVDDPNMGRKQFTYDGFGAVDTQTDANGDTMDTDYDALGRVRLLKVNGSQRSAWHYDSAPNGIGLLHFEEGAQANYRKTFYYDNYSRVVRSETRIDNDVYSQDTIYDTVLGRPKGLVYPNGLTLAYDYNADGELTAVKNAASSYVYQSISETNAFGAWTRSNLAAGTITATRSYSPATGQMDAFSMSNALGLIHGQTYDQYDGYGNLRETEITTRTSQANGITESFVYDDLHRLTSSSRSNGETIDYDYDAAGNLTKKSDYAPNYYYDGHKPNAVSSVDLRAGGRKIFGYDNNGNLSHENGTQTLWYNVFDKPTQITRMGTRLQFFYGADEMRIKQINHTKAVHTHYVDKAFERITDADGIKHRLFLGEVAVLTLTAANDGYSKAEIGFTHRDRLGSAVAITDHLGVIKETQSFDPFGKPRVGDNSDKAIPILASRLTTRGFTDHEHLDGVQLIHMNGRGYDYNLGRFLSVDPVIQSPGNSQSLNPYSYIMNNPLSGTDPTGYSKEEEQQPKVHTKDIKVKMSQAGRRLPTTETVTVSVDDNGNVTGASGGSSGARDTAKSYVGNAMKAPSSRSNVGGAGGGGGSLSGSAQQGSGNFAMPETSVQHSVSEPTASRSELREAPNVEEMLVIGPKRKSMRTANPLQGAINHFYLGMARRHAMNAIINAQYSKQNHFVSWLNFADAANQAAVYSTLLIGGGSYSGGALLAARQSAKQMGPALLLTANLAGEVGTLRTVKGLTQMAALQVEVGALRAGLSHASYAEIQHLTFQSLNRAASKGAIRMPSAGQGSAAASNPRWYVPPVPVWDDNE